MMKPSGVPLSELGTFILLVSRFFRQTAFEQQARVRAQWFAASEQVARPLFCLYAILLASFTTCSASAQEALYNSLAGETATSATRSKLETLPYTLRLWDLRVTLNSSVAVSWNDNITTSSSSPESDFIFCPAVQIGVFYPITQNNLLTVNVTAGYDKYFQHDNLSTWYLGSDTLLSYDLAVKDILINLHDSAQYSRDSAQQAAVADTADYAVIDNTAGLKVNWNLKKVTLTAGYDNENVISETQQFEANNRSTEMALGRAGFQVYSGITAGIEGTASFTRYEEMVLNDNSGYSAGVYADWNPDEALRLQARAGYANYQFQHTSETIQTANLESWYVDINFSHQVTKAISYSLDAGHEINLGIQADALEDWYLRPEVQWKIMESLAFNLSLNYEHGKQGVGNIAGNLTENYDWLAGGFGTSYAITKRFSLGLDYRLTVRSSSAAQRSYQQNLVSLSVNYSP